MMNFSIARFRFKSLRTPANYLVINLAVADFLIMLEAPIFVYNSYHLGPAFGNTREYFLGYKVRT